MVHFCCVINCGNRSVRDHKSFYRFPALITHQGLEKEKTSRKRREKWVANIARKDLKDLDSYYPGYLRVCSDHFYCGRPSDLLDTTNPDWAPTLKMGHTSSSTSGKSSVIEKFERNVLREEKKNKMEAAKALMELSVSNDFEVLDDDNNTFLLQVLSNSIAIQTDLSLDDISTLERENITLKECVNNQTIEIVSLKEKVLRLYQSEESFSNDDHKTLFYTGLQSTQMLLLLYNFLKPYLLIYSNSIGPFQQVLLTLMRLRLNLRIQDLSYRFESNSSTVSRVFLKLIDVFHTRLSWLVKWPSREELQLTMPLSFQEKFGKKVAVIVDCFEVFCQRPSALETRAQSFSHYKQHNTVKFLMGITPQGSISFISEGFGGRCTDTLIVRESNILENLLPGDLVLADRGFDIIESVGLYCAEVNIPTKCRGKKQLSPYDVEKTRKIASVRIHVERLIGQLKKKYSIFQDRLPIQLLNSKEGELAQIDKIVKVCCALVNLTESVVPFT